MKDNEKKAFSITYSGSTKDELEMFKEKYTPKQTTEKMKKIRALDKRIDFIATMCSISIGLLGSCFIIWSTISLVKELNSFPAGILILLLGITIIAAVPFIHTKIYNGVKNHYAPQILSLIDEIERNII